jgi:hypothetical protein
MPQSRRRYGRAAMRARYRKPRRRRGGSMGWNIAIAVVVIVGILGVILAVSGNKSASGGSGPPRAANQSTGQPGDHWHTYLGVDICGEWLTPVPAFEQAADNSSVTAGIHSHGDGLIHTHPFTSSEEGTNATLGKYAEYGGWSVSADSIDAWTGPKSAPEKKSWSNGDTCTNGSFKGKKGEIVWAVDGKVRTGDPSAYHQQDGATIAIGFLPKGTKVPFPPDACSAFANISDQQTAAAVSKNSPCRTEATTTTVAPASTEPPPTTVAP